MKKSVLRTTFIALFAAIICFGCFIKIHLGVVPIVLQNILCILCAVLLGGIWGAAPTALFLLAGLIGLPVYSGGSGGIAVWLGPTGGFLPGYLIGSIAASFIAGKPCVEEKEITKRSAFRVVTAIIAGVIILYIPGVIRFAYWATAAGKIPQDTSTFVYTMSACVIPYVPGDVVKISVAIPLALKLRPVVAQYLYDDTNDDTEDNSDKD